MAFETLLYEKGDGIAVLTLNRPESLNSVNTKMQAEMKEAWDDIEQDRSIRVIIITGGEKCFSAGADIREQFPPGVAPPASRDPLKKKEDFVRPSLSALK